MRNQTVRLFVYSSLAILILTLVWGVRQVPQQSELAEKALKTSLEQELIMLSGAVKASTQALKFRLLDVLKAEGNDKPTRAFQDSPFAAAALLEWDQSTWKSLWHSSKLNELQANEVKALIKDWPLSRIAPDQAHFGRLIEVQNQTYFAVIVPVRKPNNVPMLGVGIFNPQTFGLMFSAERNRNVSVFDSNGFALALSHPAYLGATLKRDILVKNILEADEVSLREEWTNDRGMAMLGGAIRMSDSNLYAAIEMPLDPARGGRLQGWLYLMLCAAGAIALNWALFSSLVQPLFRELNQTEQINEQLKRQLLERPVHQPARAIPSAALPEHEFIEEMTPSAAVPEAPAPVTLAKVVGSALRSLDGRIQENGISVKQGNFENIHLEGDILQLQTAIEEILKNAIEAMHASNVRELNLRANLVNGYVHLNIEDTGCGIPDENLNRVFDPFFSTKDSQGVARGLGLNVVRRVLEELEGQVQLKVGTSGGIRVELQWPMRPDQKRAEQRPNEPVKPATTDVDPDLDFLESDNDEEFATKAWPNVNVRKPKVRGLSIED